MGERDWIEEMGEQVAAVRRAATRARRAAKQLDERVAEREKVARLERERDEALAQLAALREAAVAFRNRDPVHDAVRLLGYEPFTHPETGETLYRATDVARPTFVVLDGDLADSALSADAFVARKQAEELETEAAGLSERAKADRAVSREPGDAWRVRAAFLEGEAERLRARAAELRGGR